jgi:hypothetical protein
MCQSRSKVEGSDLFEVYIYELLLVYRSNKKIEDELKAKAAAAAEEAAKPQEEAKEGDKKQAKKKKNKELPTQI